MPYRFRLQVSPGSGFRAGFFFLRGKPGNSSVVADQDSSSLPVSPTLTVVQDSEPQPTRGFGSQGSVKGFSLLGKKRLREAGAALDYLSPPEFSLFLTGTLPGSGDLQFRAIAEWSGWIVDRLKSWLSKYLSNRSEFYCWEYQKRGALHLHWCVCVPCSVTREKIKARFKRQWIRLLIQVGKLARCNLFLNTRTGVNFRRRLADVQAYAQEVRKSVGAYLSKYLSKSTGSGFEKRFVPSNFWGVSRPLLKTCESLSVRWDKDFESYGEASAYVDRWRNWMERSNAKICEYRRGYLAAGVLCFPSRCQFLRIFGMIQKRKNSRPQSFVQRLYDVHQKLLAHPVFYQAGVDFGIMLAPSRVSGFQKAHNKEAIERFFVGITLCPSSVLTYACESHVQKQLALGIQADCREIYQAILHMKDLVPPSLPSDPLPSVYDQKELDLTRDG